MMMMMMMMMIIIIIIITLKGWGEQTNIVYGAYATGWTVRGSEPDRSKRFSILRNVPWRTAVGA